MTNRKPRRRLHNSEYQSSPRLRAFAPIWIFLWLVVNGVAFNQPAANAQDLTTESSETQSRDQPQTTEEFAVLTDVYLQADRNAATKSGLQNSANDIRISQNATYFLRDKIVDVTINDSGQIEQATVLRLGTGEITLLDLSQKKKCHLSDDELFQAVAAVTSRLDDDLARPDGREIPQIVRFAANAKFKVDWNEESGRLGMIAEPMGYLIQSAKQPTGNAARLYRRFADMSARLNATRLGGLPPSARLALNRELGTHKVVPTRVERTRKDSPQKFYSTHRYLLKITPDALNRIAQVAKWTNELEAVDLASFRLAK